MGFVSPISLQEQSNIYGKQKLGILYGAPKLYRNMARRNYTEISQWNINYTGSSSSLSVFGWNECSTSFFVYSVAALPLRRVKSLFTAIEFLARKPSRRGVKRNKIDASDLFSGPMHQPKTLPSLSEKTEKECERMDLFGWCVPLWSVIALVVLPLLIFLLLLLFGFILKDFGSRRSVFAEPNIENVPWVIDIDNIAYIT